MPQKKTFLTFLIADIALFIVYELSKWILRINHLAYRNAVNYPVYAVLIILTLVILVQVIFFLFRRAKRKEEKMPIRILSGIGIVAILAFIAFSSISIFMRGVFGHQPEHVVEKDGRTMLARVDSFLQVEVRYYEYVNALVRGSGVQIHEDYGNGGYDPFEWEEMPKVQRYIYYGENGEITKSNWFDGYGTSLPSDEKATEPDDSEQAPITKLDIEAVVNRENELVFNFSIDDFIASYNGYYWEDNRSAYLTASSEWTRFKYENTVHSTHETYLYSFSENPQIWSMPTISVYVPTDSNGIQGITLEFDDHGYTEPMYLLYEEISSYSLRVLFPNCNDGEISLIYTTLREHVDDNFFGDNYDMLPSSIYYKDNIGMYGYYGAGTANICIFPVTLQYLESLSAQGIEIFDINSVL